MPSKCQLGIIYITVAECMIATVTRNAGPVVLPHLPAVTRNAGPVVMFRSVTVTCFLASASGANHVTAIFFGMTAHTTRAGYCPKTQKKCIKNKIITCIL